MWWKILLIVVASIIVLFLIVVTIVTNVLFNKNFLRTKEGDPDIFNQLDTNGNKDWKLFVPEMKETIKKMKALKLEDIYIESFDGLKLHANLYPAVKKTNNYIISVHGYKGNRFQDYSFNMKYMHDDFNILFIDLRGHGESDGNIITYGVLDNLDLVKWEEYLHQKYGKEINLFIHGLSMGCATALMASNKLHNTQGIIADCGYTSGYEIIKSAGKKIVGKMIGILMPFMCLTVRLRGHYDLKKEDARESLKHTEIPVLFIHGEDDDFVPTYMGKQNYEACMSPKELVLYKDTGHALNGLKNYEDYKEKVLTFIEKYKKEKSA